MKRSGRSSKRRAAAGHSSPRAGASGQRDVSERIEAIITGEVARSH